MSTKGDQSASLRLSPFPTRRVRTPIRFGNPPRKKPPSRFCSSSSSPKGFHVINLFIIFTFLDRLLSDSTLILRTLSEQAPSNANARRLHRNWSIPEPIVISDQNGYSTLSEFRREPHFQVQTCTLEVSCWCAGCRAYWQSL